MSAVFITFPGNCKKALRFYQSCFGGQLQLEFFEPALQPYKEKPVISGSLLADRLSIYGSDLVHNEGRKMGNAVSILLHCKNRHHRKELIEKLAFDKGKSLAGNYDDYQLIEVKDAFDVSWVLGVQ